MFGSNSNPNTAGNKQLKQRAGLPSRTAPPNANLSAAANSPLIGPQYQKYMANGEPRERIGVDYGVFRHCEGFNCDLPYIPCNHATPPLYVEEVDPTTGKMTSKSNWKTLDFIRFIANIVCQNVCYMFVLAYLLIEYAPQDSVINLLFYGLARGANMFFLNMMYAELTGAYVNPFVTLAVWAAWWLTYRTAQEDMMSEGKKNEDNAKIEIAPAPAGYELLKGLIVWIFSFGGLWLGILFVWLTFIGPGPYAGFDFGSPIFVGGLSSGTFTNGVVLSTWQGIVREGLATLMLTGVTLFAHSDPRVRNHSTLAAIHIAGVYVLVSFLFGQTTNAIMNPFYWLVTRLLNISGGDGFGLTLQGFLVYVVGPAGGALVGFLLFLIRHLYLQWACASPVCVIYNRV